MNWETVVDFFKALHWQTVVDFFKALLTPAIGILTMVIAVAQYRLAKAKHRHELYERRSAVYKATMKFIAQVTSGGNAKLDEAHTFLQDTSEVAFLFRLKRIPAFLKELYDKAIDLNTANTLLDSPRATQEELVEESRKKNDLVSWFHDQFDECRRLFTKDLSLV